MVLRRRNPYGCHRRLTVSLRRLDTYLPRLHKTCIPKVEEWLQTPVEKTSIGEIHRPTGTRPYFPRRPS